MLCTSEAQKDWQTPRSTIRERCALVFNNDFLSDVNFKARSSICGEGKVIPAHKFVLSISSPVFLVMFHGNMAESVSNLIELPDCDYESLLEFFRYLYSDEAHLTGTNVLQVLYLANKYIVPSLVEKCTEYLQNNLDANNVFCILPHAPQTFDENGLLEHCWEVIDKNADIVVKSEEFVNLDKCLMETIVNRESLNITEFELFKAVDRWASKESERQGLRASLCDVESKRRVLGERIVQAIRFPLMSQKEFMSVVPDSNILTTSEVINLMKYFSGLPTPPMSFLQTPRKGTIKNLPQMRRRLGTYIPPAAWWGHTVRNCQSICSSPLN